MKPQKVLFLLAICLLTLSLSLISPSVHAKVTGPCANCHTMHNSQGGTDLSSEPQPVLLVDDCVGCHSSTTSDTIITVEGGGDIPIVYNISEPTKPLAGGNFHWVAQMGDDNLGHNVYGITSVDALDKAPGKSSGAASPCSDVDGCHMSLAYKPSPTNFNRGGCQGCHVFVAHHDDSRPWYRFLKGHSSVGVGGLDPNNINGLDYVLGTEKSKDDDWEYTTDSSTDHNFYQGTKDEYPDRGLDIYQTVTAFCTGCHGDFHGPKRSTFGMGSEGTHWIRHPTDILLPNESEYAAYDPVNNYSVEAPVAWLDPDNPTRDGAVVMCLSCHRAHGSPYPDMLRWDYDNMKVGGGGVDTGCFTCHTEKND